MAAAYPLPVIDVRVLTGVRDYLESRGVPFAELLRRFGLDSDTDGFVSLNGVALLFEAAAEHLDDPDVGIKAGLALPLGSSGLLGHIMLSAPTVGDMLRATAGYMPIYSRPLTCLFKEDNGVGQLTWRFSQQLVAPRTQYSLFGLTALICRVRIAAGVNWMPLGIDCDFVPPTDRTLLVKVLGQRFNVQQTHCAIWFDPNVLAIRMPKMMEGLDQTARRLGDIELKELKGRESQRAKVETQLLARMRDGRALHLDDVAEDLGITPRALQYRLELEGTSHEAVLGGVRSREALRYLRDTDLNLSKIAERLGFSEASAFTRAIRNRFDMAPRDLRRELRGGRMFTTDIN